MGFPLGGLESVNLWIDNNLSLLSSLQWAHKVYCTSIELVCLLGHHGASCIYGATCFESLNSIINCHLNKYGHIIMMAREDLVTDVQILSFASLINPHVLIILPNSVVNLFSNILDLIVQETNLHVRVATICGFNPLWEFICVWWKVDISNYGGKI